jgi:LmbE family N-acetylglucosaminyl deacetylase
MTRTLLAVFAHPDDESNAAGGTLARYVREGTQVILVRENDCGVIAQIERGL